RRRDGRRALGGAEAEPADDVGEAVIALGGVVEGEAVGAAQDDVVAAQRIGGAKAKESVGTFAKAVGRVASKEAGRGGAAARVEGVEAAAGQLQVRSGATLLAAGEDDLTACGGECGSGVAGIAGNEPADVPSGVVESDDADLVTGGSGPGHKV